MVQIAKKNSTYLKGGQLCPATKYFMLQKS